MEYTKLPGKGLKQVGCLAVVRTTCTLWRADDHILSVENHVFAEDYKRFYFRDIQAITVQKTKRGRNWNIVLSAFAGLFLLLAIWVGGSGALPLLVVSGTFLLGLVINAWRGPTCTCKIFTQVQEETLPSLGRLKRAETVIPILRRKVESVQGKLNLDEIQES